MMKKGNVSFILVSFLVISAVLGALSGRVAAQTSSPSVQLIVNGNQIEWHTTWAVSAFQLELALSNGEVKTSA